MAQKGLLWLIGLLLLLPTSDSQQSQGRPAPTTYAEIARLTFSDADNKPFSSVAISGDRVVVGSFYGVAAVFQANTHQVVKLSAADVVDQEADRFGRSVAIDGNTVVVGACDGEAAYVFRTSDGGATYGQVAKLTASDGMLSDRFGISVAIDGDTVVVGAYAKENYSGAAYVFHTTDGGFTYDQVAKLTAANAAAGDQFGLRVALDGDYVVVGAYAGSIHYPPGGSGWGSVYVFRTTDGGTTYGQVVKLTAADAAKGDDFGRDVAIDGDTIVVSAPEKSGAAYVLRTTDGWSTFTEIKLTAADSTTYGGLGISVAIDGDYVAVGTLGNDYTRSAYVFRTTDGGATYGQVAKLSLSGAHTYRLGTFVAIGGDTIAVSPCWDPYYPDKRATTDALGSVHVFNRVAPPPAPLPGAPVSTQDQTGNDSDVSAGGGGGSGAPSFAFLGTDVVIAIFVVVGLLLFATASSLKYRRVRRLLVSDSASDLTQEQLDRQNDAANVVERAKRVRDVVLAVGSAFPIIGNLMEVVGGLLGSADDFKNDVEGLLIAIRRVERIKEWVKLIERNQRELRVDQADVESKKELLVETIKTFKKAMRQFVKQHWCSRICTVQTHISSLLGLDTDIEYAMKELEKCYQYSRDTHQIQGTNEIRTGVNEIRARNDDFDRRLNEIQASNEELLTLVRQNVFQASQPEVSALLAQWLRYFHQDRRRHRDGQLEMHTIENPLRKGD